MVTNIERVADRGSNKQLALTLLCAGSFLAVLDTTIVTIALPSIQRDLGFSGAGTQWILNSYAIVFGGLLLLLSRLGDAWGRRRLFAGGLALFGAASLLAGLATTHWVLIVARVIQGLGGAALVPMSLSLLTEIFREGEERNRALGVYGAMAALGFVCGMVGGGIITEFLGWRWVFFAGVAPALLVAATSLAAIPDSQDPSAPRALDVPGAMTVTAGLAAVIYGVSTVPVDGWTSAPAMGFVAFGLVLLAAFVAVEQRSAAPLIPLSVFRQRALLMPNLAILLQSMIGIGWLYVLTFYFQDVLDRTALVTGLLFLPMTVASVVAAPTAGSLVTRFGMKTTAVCGLAFVIIGLLLMATMRASTGLVVVLTGTVVGEFGFMLSSVSLTIAATGGVIGTEHGLKAGLLNTYTQLGNALGLGVIATIVAAGSEGAGVLPQRESTLIVGLRWGVLACIPLALAGLFLVLVSPHERRLSEAGMI